MKHKRAHVILFGLLAISLPINAHSQEVIEEREVVSTVREVRPSAHVIDAEVIPAEVIEWYEEQGYRYIDPNTAVINTHEYGITGKDQYFSRVDTFDQNSKVLELAKNNSNLDEYKVELYEDQDQLYVVENIIHEPNYASDAVEHALINTYIALGETFYILENEKNISAIWYDDAIRKWEDHIRKTYYE